VKEYEGHFFIFGQLLESDNIIRGVMLWKKILLLRGVLFTPLAPNVNFTFWMSAYSRVIGATSHWACSRSDTFPPWADAEAAHKAKLSRSRALMETGEISYRKLQVLAVSVRRVALP